MCGIKDIFILTYAEVMMRLNAIMEIEMKYNRTIRLWLDLSHEKNNIDFHIRRQAAVT
jgi:hypothetical protein